MRASVHPCASGTRFSPVHGRTRTAAVGVSWVGPRELRFDPAQQRMLAAHLLERAPVSALACLISAQHYR